MDAIEDILSAIYNVKVPRFVTYTDFDFYIAGTPVDTYDGNALRNTDKELTNCYLSLGKIISVYEYGYPIYLVKSEDSKKIFDKIDSIIKLSEEGRYMVNKPNIPDSFIDRITKFASEIFNNNRRAVAGHLLEQANNNFGFIPMGTPTSDVALQDIRLRYEPEEVKTNKGTFTDIPITTKYGGTL